MLNLLLCIMLLLFVYTMMSCAGKLQYDGYGCNINTVITDIISILIGGCTLSDNNPRDHCYHGYQRVPINS